MKDGKKVTGWMQDSNADWYYFAADGRMVDGWQFIGGEWYFFQQSHDGHFGAMCTGWLFDGGFWYYLSETHDGSFGKMTTGWQQVKGAWYYLYPQTGAPKGSCAINTTTPDGYRVDESGRWIQ